MDSGRTADYVLRPTGAAGQRGKILARRQTPVDATALRAYGTIGGTPWLVHQFVKGASDLLRG
jgi:hypothetical protein